MISKKRKEQIAERDGWVCNGCGRELKQWVEEQQLRRPDYSRLAVIDHKVPTSRGGSNDDSNLWLLCFTCNSEKGSKTVAEWEASLDWSGSFMRRGFTMIPNVLLDAGDISMGAKMTLFHLMRFAWRSDPFPGQARLALLLGCTDRTVRDYLGELRDAGYVNIKRRGRGQTNVYRLVQNKFLSVPRPEISSALDRKPASDKEYEVEEGEEPKGSSCAPGENGRAKNVVWDALVEVFGEPTTASRTKLRGKICSSLTRAGATPEEILRRAKSWPRYFDDATLTETALEKHWDMLGRPPLRATR